MDREITDDDATEYAEEYYNCGYDGVYEPKEKGILFRCVGRGLKIPPLSKIYFPSFIVNSHSMPPPNVRPSHHVLDLVAPSVTAQESNPSKEPADKPQSSQNDQCCDDQSESSDLDVFISDEDDGVDECDCYSARTDCDAETLVLPSNMMGKTVCSASGNKLLLSEVHDTKNERDDSFTSDDEVLSNPSVDDDSYSDNEGISVPTNNLNQTISYSIGKNSPNDFSSTGGEKNIYLDEDLSVTNTLSSGVKYTSETSPITDQPSFSSDDSNPSETICSEGKKGFAVERRDSSSSNGSNDPVAKLFSNDGSAEDILNHFRTFNREADKNFEIGCQGEFPELSGKQMKKPQKEDYRVPSSIPVNQLNFKHIASLLMTKPDDTDNEKNVNVEINNKECETQIHQQLVIENLPQDFKVSSLENMLNSFELGPIEDILMLPGIETTTARVRFSRLTGNLEWAIECLNESEAFGAGEAPLRCYAE